MNCASQEYFKAVNLDALIPEVITPVFMEERNGKNKIISFFAKKARGLMARYIIEKRITKKEDLKNFKLDNYVYEKSLSSEKDFVFLRRGQ